jgi:hypothetical protein
MHCKAMQGNARQCKAMQGKAVQWECNAWRPMVGAGKQRGSRKGDSCRSSRISSSAVPPFSLIHSILVFTTNNRRKKLVRIGGLAGTHTLSGQKCLQFLGCRGRWQRSCTACRRCALQLLLAEVRAVRAAANPVHTPPRIPPRESSTSPLLSARSNICCLRGHRSARSAGADCVSVSHVRVLSRCRRPSPSPSHQKR